MYELVWFNEAKVEYDKLDGLQKIQVNKGLKQIIERDIKAKKNLEKKKYNLSICREIRMKRLGLHIVFKQNTEKIDIIDIISVGKRADEEVFKITAKRLGVL